MHLRLGAIGVGTDRLVWSSLAEAEHIDLAEQQQLGRA